MFRIRDNATKNVSSMSLSLCLALQPLIDSMLTCEVVCVVFVEKVVDERQRLPHTITDTLRRQVEHQR